MNVFGFLVFFISIKKGNSYELISNYTMNWLDAQRFCHERGTISRRTKLDLDESKTGEYWTRVYTKRSRLIHIYGCFHEEAVTNLIIFNQTTKEMSPGKCQDICLDKGGGHDTFAIQENTCTCLDGPPASTLRLHNKKCLFCHQNMGFCGGNQSFYVYRTNTTGDFEHSMSKHNAMKNDGDICIQLLCDKHNTSKFSQVSCESKRPALCTKGVITKATIWGTAIAECAKKSTKVSNETLKSDIDLSSSPWNVCIKNSISSHQQLWLGIRTLQYDAECENGEESDVHVEDALRCQSCETGCKFRKCSDRLKAACEPLSKRVTEDGNDSVGTNYPSKLSTNVPTTPQSTPKTRTTPNSTPKTRRAPKSTLKTRPTHKNKSLPRGTDSHYRSITEESCSPHTGSRTSIAAEITEANTPNDLLGNKYATTIYISSAAPVAIVLVICFSCMYFRKKRQRKEAKAVNADTSNTCRTNLVAKTDIYELADNSKLSPLYSVAENIIAEKADTGGRISEQDYWVETTEIKPAVKDDIYNHLREVTPSDQQSENIYDHTTQRDAERDESLYDVTKTETNTQVIPDSTYGHVSPVNITRL